MKRFVEGFENVFTAVSFAEQGEWDDAVKIANGSLKCKAAEGKQKHTQEKVKRQSVDHRPRLRL